MELNDATFLDDEEMDHLDTRRSATECICPKCRASHKVKLFWTGRGTPRKFCSTCRKSFPTIDLAAASPAPLLQKALYSELR